MRCARAKTLLLEFEDAPLPENVQAHLDACAACRVAFEQSQTVRKLVSLKRYERPSAETESRIVMTIHRRLVEESESIRAADPRRRLRQWITLEPLPLLRYAAAALFVALLSIHVFTIPQLSLEGAAEPGIQTPTVAIPAQALAATSAGDAAYPIYPGLQTNRTVGPRHIEYGATPSTLVSFEY